MCHSLTAFLEIMVIIKLIAVNMNILPSCLLILKMGLFYFLYLPKILYYTASFSDNSLLFPEFLLLFVAIVKRPNKMISETFAPAITKNPII